ncbi:MAG: DUF4153 domain-containing protein, partial [Cruoricaptor ignavus]|nr:DUF4153 domain-containing protein [Cruoricaptor ignavus]
MKPKIQKLYSKTTEVFLRYPTIIAVALIAAISAVIGIEMDNYFDSEHQFQVGKLIIISTIGISAMFAVKMLSQRIGKGFLLESITAILLISFYFVLPKTKTDFTIIHFILLVVIYILSHLLVSFIAFLGKDKELNFWQYNKNLFINIFLTVVFTGVLVGGFLLAILAVEQLFNFNFNGQIYPKTFVFLAILGSTLIFLIFNDRGLPNLENDENYPQILKFFTQFVLVPLLFIYLVILYFYTGKILINWELPRGWVSYLVLAYSIVG